MNNVFKRYKQGIISLQEWSDYWHQSKISAINVSANYRRDIPYWRVNVYIRMFMSGGGRDGGVARLRRQWPQFKPVFQHFASVNPPEQFDKRPWHFNVCKRDTSSHFYFLATNTLEIVPRSIKISKYKIWIQSWAICSHVCGHLKC